MVAVKPVNPVFRNPAFYPVTLLYVVFLALKETIVVLGTGHHLQASITMLLTTKQVIL